MTKEKISLLLVLCLSVNADKMTHQFKSPSFSGIGTSSHYLTIENQEFNRKEANKAELEEVYVELEEAYAELEEAYVELEEANAELEEANAELEEAVIELEEANVELEVAITELETDNYNNE